MNATGRVQLEDVISDALPGRLPPDVHKRLTAKTVDAVRLWQEFRQERARKKKQPQEAGADLMKLANKALRALEKARQQIGSSTSYKEAVDNLVWAQDNANAMVAHLASLLVTQKSMGQVMVDNLMWATDTADAKEPPMHVWGAMRGAISERNKGLDAADRAFFYAQRGQRHKLTNSAESLDFALARGLTHLQLWIDGHKKHRGRSRDPATDLAESLVEVLKAEGVTEDEIDDMFTNKLNNKRALAWLPRLSFSAAKKQTQRGMERATLAFAQNWLNPRTKRTKQTRRTD